MRIPSRVLTPEDIVVVHFSGRPNLLSNPLPGSPGMSRPTTKGK